MHSLNLGFVWGVKLTKMETEYLINDYCGEAQKEDLKQRLISIGKDYEQGAIYGHWVKEYSNVANLKNELLSLEEIRHKLAPNFSKKDIFLDKINKTIPESWGLRIPDIYFVSFWM